MKTNEERILKTAYRELNIKGRVLSPASDARIVYPEHDPCRARMPIAIVYWPGFNSQLRPTDFSHAIFDGDHI